MVKLIYIASHNTELYKIDLSGLGEKDFEGAHIICATRLIYEELLDVEIPFRYESIDYFNIQGRKEDDFIYRISQEYCLEILSNIEEKYISDNIVFSVIMESISLSGADSFAAQFRQLLMLKERAEKLNCIDVYATGQNAIFLHALKGTLELNGIDCSIIANGTPSNLKFERVFSRLNRDENLKFYTIIPLEIEIDFDNYIKDYTVDLKSEDGIILFSITDAFYRENVAYLSSSSELYNVNLTCLNNSIDSKDNYFLNSIQCSHLPSGRRCMELDGVLQLRKGIQKAFQLSDKSVFNNHGIIFHENFIKMTMRQLVIDAIYGDFYFRLFSFVLPVTKQKFLLVSPGRTLISRVAVEAANQLGIPTFELQCGTLTKSSRYWAPNAKTVFCADVASRDVYRSYFKIPDDNLVLAGSPRMDRITAPLRAEYSKRERDGKSVFLALQTSKYDYNIRYIAEVIRALDELPGYRLTVGFHPKDPETNRKPVLEFLSGRTDIKISDKESLPRLMECDVCVTYYSSLAFEAYSIGLEVIAFRIDKTEWPFRLSELGFASEADDYLELRDRLREIETRPKGEGQLDIYRDGKSAERIWAEIDRQVGNNRTNIFKRLWKRMTA